MKVKCPISGLDYEVSFPEVGKVSCPHPMLYMEANSLTKNYLQEWAAGSLSKELKHLLGLAYLLKLPLVSLPSLSANSCNLMADFWDKNMEKLAKVAERLEDRAVIKGIPSIRVSTDNLTNLKHWLEDLDGKLSWASQPASTEQVKKLNSAQFKADELAKRDTTRNIAMYSSEEINELIVRGLKGSLLNKKESRAFPSLVADWTNSAAPFPTAKVTLPISGKKVSIADHWKNIICHAFTATGVVDILSDLDITLGDIDELLEHCYAEVEVGTIHSSALFEKLGELRAGVEDYKLNPPKQTVKQTLKKVAKMKDEDLLLLLTSDDTPSSAEALLTSTHPVTPASTENSGMTLAQRLAMKLKRK